MGSMLHLPGGHIGADPNPASAGGVVTISYTGPGDIVYWKVAGEGGTWQALRFAEGSSSVTLRVPEDAEFLDFNDRRYPNPSTLTLRVSPHPAPEGSVP